MRLPFLGCEIPLCTNFSALLSLVPDSLPYRRPSLLAVEIAVCRVDSDTVTVQWEVGWNGSTYRSSVYESQVVVMLLEKVLTIYMPAKYLKKYALPPLDLTYDLVALLGIPPERSALVEQILTRLWDSDATEIENALTKRGYQFDFSDGDGVQGEWRYNINLERIRITSLPNYLDQPSFMTSDEANTRLTLIYEN